MSRSWKIIGGIGLVFVLMQLWPVDRANPPVGRAAMALPAGEVGEVLRAACMDCHSHETVWPWYGRVAPGSWFMAWHVAEGREHMNLSTWGDLAADRQDHNLEEIIEMVEEAEMPLRSYTLLHGEARLSAAQRQALIDWAIAERARLSAESPAGSRP